MEIEPLMTRRISAGTRVYYFDACEDRKGQIFISVSEIPTDSSPGRKKRRNRLFVHSLNFDQFAGTLNEFIEETKKLISSPRINQNG